MVLGFISERDHAGRIFGSHAPLHLRRISVLTTAGENRRFLPWIVSNEALVRLFAVDPNLGVVDAKMHKLLFSLRSYQFLCP